MSIASGISLAGSSLSSSARYVSTNAICEGNDNCDCSQGGDCYCTDCNEGGDDD